MAKERVYVMTLRSRHFTQDCELCGQLVRLRERYRVGRDREQLLGGSVRVIAHDECCEREERRIKSGEEGSVCRTS